MHRLHSTADVFIQCKNGVIPTHRLVLASISHMMLSIFKQDSWDEPITVLLNDYSVEQVDKYFMDFFKFGFKNNEYSPLATILGVKETLSSRKVKNEDVEKGQLTNGTGKHENQKENLSHSPSYLVDVKLKEENSESDCADEDFVPKFDEEYDQQDSDFSANETKEVKEKRPRKIKKEKKKKDIDDPSEKKKKKQYYIQRKKELDNTDEGGGSTYVSEARQYFIEDEEDPKSAICKICSRSFSKNSSRMRKHLMFMHTDIYKTLKPVTSKNHVSKRHDAKKKYGQYYTEIEDNPNRVRCTLCNGAFSSANINRHINQKHNIYKEGEAPKQVLCSFCGKVFRDNWHRMEHEALIHQKLKRHVCSFCGESFSYQKFLDEHLQKHIDETNADLFPFVCSICGRKFMKKNSLDSHDCEARFQCNECGIFFSQKHNLKTHEKTCYLFSHCREAIRNLTCTECNITFSNYQKMKQHCLQSTTCTLLGRKPFQCNDCKKFFTSEKRLTIHMRVHTGEKPYQCNICQQKFKFQFRLSNHKCLH